MRGYRDGTIIANSLAFTAGQEVDARAGEYARSTVLVRLDALGGVATDTTVTVRIAGDAGTYTMGTAVLDTVGETAVVEIPHTETVSLTSSNTATLSAEVRGR